MNVFLTQWLRSSVCDNVAVIIDAAYIGVRRKGEIVPAEMPCYFKYVHSRYYWSCRSDWIPGMFFVCLFLVLLVFYTDKKKNWCWMSLGLGHSFAAVCRKEEGIQDSCSKLLFSHVLWRGAVRKKTGRNANKISKEESIIMPDSYIMGKR